jgi:hypothetical protein
MNEKEIGALMIELAMAGATGMTRTYHLSLADASRILTVAKDAGLQCVVARALAGNEPADRVFRDCIVRSLRFQHDLMILEEMMAGLPRVVLLKGGAMKYLIYADPALRHSVDIDILVRPRDLVDVINSLKKQGFSLDTTPIMNKPFSGRLGHEITVVHPDLNLPVEIHTGLSQQYRFPHDIEDFMMKAKPLPGFEVFLAANLPWALVHEGIHLAQLGYRQPLKHLMDLWLLWNRMDGAEIDTAWKIASQCQARRALHYGLIGAEYIFGGRDGPWSIFFNKYGPLVSRSPFPRVPTMILTSPMTCDSVWQFLRWMGIKVPLQLLDYLVGPWLKPKRLEKSDV